MLIRTKKQVLTVKRVSVAVKVAPGTVLQILKAGKAVLERVLVAKEAVLAVKKVSLTRKERKGVPGSVNKVPGKAVLMTGKVAKVVSETVN